MPVKSKITLILSYSKGKNQGTVTIISKQNQNPTVSDAVTHRLPDSKGFATAHTVPYPTSHRALAVRGHQFMVLASALKLGCTFTNSIFWVLFRDSGSAYVSSLGFSP